MKHKILDSKNVDQICSDLESKLKRVKKACEERSGQKVSKDPSLMAKGPTPMFKKKEEAEKVMANPDLIFIRQSIKNMIDDALKD